jgi:hypothetical protein
LRFELLQEAEARRSGRVPGSAVLCHAETLLAAVRHLITNANSAAHFLHPRAATGAKLHGGERIALIIKRREASNAAGGDRAWGKFLHSRDVLRTATEPMTAKEIASGVLAAANITDAYQPKGNAPNAVDLHGAAGCQIWTFGLAFVHKHCQVLAAGQN